MLFKILVAVAIAALAWMLVTRMTRPAAKPSVGKGDRDSLEMAPCSVCGAYVSKGDATGCGRADCPYGRGG